jgi:hypothetical protein
MNTRAVLNPTFSSPVAAQFARVASSLYLVLQVTLRKGLTFPKLHSLWVREIEDGVIKM